MIYRIKYLHKHVLFDHLGVNMLMFGGDKLSPCTGAEREMCEEKGLESRGL